MVALSDEGRDSFGLEQLPAHYQSEAERSSRAVGPPTSAPPPPVPCGNLDDPQLQALLEALARNDGIVVRAADQLGITRQKAYRLLSRQKSLGLDEFRKRRSAVLQSAPRGPVPAS
jgi:transcriptional regulator of acetoin/glycerol metabolism